MILDLYPIGNNILMPVRKEPIELQIPEQMKGMFWTKAETLNTKNPDSGFYFYLTDKKVIPKEKKWKVIPCIVLRNKRIGGGEKFHITTDVVWEDLLGHFNYQYDEVDYNLVYIFPEFLKELKTKSTVRTKKSVWEEIATQKILLELRNYYNYRLKTDSYTNSYKTLNLYFLLSNLDNWIKQDFTKKRIRKQLIKDMLQELKERCKKIENYYILEKRSYCFSYYIL